MKLIVKKHSADKMRGMTDEKPHYKWPKYVLAAVIIFVVASLIWVTVDVLKIKQERNINAPIQTH